MNNTDTQNCGRFYRPVRIDTTKLPDLLNFSARLRRSAVTRSHLRTLTTADGSEDVSASEIHPCRQVVTAMRDGADGPTDADVRAGTRGQTAESALGASTFLLREPRTLKSEEHQHDKE